MNSLQAALGEMLFQARVRELRAGGMSDDFIARQIVDDYYRATQLSLQEQQHVVERLVRQVKVTP